MDYGQIFREIFTTGFFALFLFFWTSWGLMYPGIKKYIKGCYLLHPNSITLYRIPISFIALYLFYKGFYFPALTLFTFAIVSDAIDGMVARSCNLHTELGKILDPLADKIVYFLPLCYFGYTGVLDLALVALFIGVDTLGQLSRTLLKFLRMETKANIFGKVKTCFVFLFIFYLMIFDRRFGELFAGMNSIGMWISIILAFLSIFFKFFSFASFLPINMKNTNPK